MSPIVLCSIPLPDPFTEQVERYATIKVMEHPPTHDELIAAVQEFRPQVLCPQLVDAIDREVLHAGAPDLRGVCLYAVGYNNVDLTAAREANVAICNTPDVLTAATADLALALILGVARRVVEGDAIMREDRFGGWSPTYFLGRDLEGARLGIVGFGRIGQAVAQRALGFGMEIIYTPHTAGRPVPATLTGQVRETTLDELLTTSDIVSLHLPLTVETTHLISADRLAMMRPTAILINTARGPIVDEEALAQALHAGRLWGAGLDVFEHEPSISPALRTAPHTLFLPHIGSATPQTRAAMAARVAANTCAILQGEPPPFEVSDPGREHGSR